jgi:methylated-DNA-[protein]-cysteine S-methyltransferase
MAKALGYCLFDTAIGPCGVAWHAQALAGVQLCEGSAAATQQRMEARFPGVSQAPPPPAVAGAIARVQASLLGAPDDLLDLPLDMTGVPEFNQRVYAIARAIPPGRTLTYGDIATQLGEPGAARAVGQALGHNPFAPVVPCHRILAAGNRAGGFSAHGSTATKLKMLEAEGARFGAQPGLFERG